jgi:5,6,7,8-tetrahydromethanopterin hydro-lyase
VTEDRGSQIGEAFVGTGADAAHVNTVLGRKGGPLEAAFATALATPRAGHVAFLTVVRPGLPVKPFTLFVNKAALASPLHSQLTWGAAQAGVASGVLAAVGDGIIARAEVDDRLLIAAVWVDPEAAEEGAVYEHNRQATRQALVNGAQGLPSLEDLLSVADAPENPFYRREKAIDGGS